MSEKLLAGVCLTVTLVCLPFVASAHATPVSYTPAASVTVLETPEAVSVQFTERIEEEASSITVYGPSGAKVNVHKGELDPTNERLLLAPITSEEEGVYTVSWQVVSVDDGHFTKGGYSFLVDAEGTVYEGGEETVSVSYSTSLPDVVASFLNLLGESIFLAISLFLFGALWHKKKVISELLLKHAAIIAFILFVFGAGVGILRKSIELSGLQEVSIWNAFLIYSTSSVGMVSLIKIAFAICFVSLFLLFLKRVSYVHLGILGVFLVCILYFQSIISHATASLFMPHVSIAVTFVHLLAKELVIGGVIVLCIHLYVLLRRKELHLYPLAALLYDIVASFALVLASTSGAYITWLHLKTSSNIWQTSWGELFLTLVTFTALFGFFRLFHQCIVHQRWNIAFLRRIYAVTLPVEVGMALCVLFYSAHISMTTPPFTVEAYTFSEQIVSEGIETHFRVHPYESSMFLLEFIEDKNGKPLDPQALTVFAEQTSRGIGPNVLQTEKRFEGGYVFPRNALSPEGAWNIHVSGSFEGRYDAQSEFSVTYPEDIEVTRYSHETRVWDDFAYTFIIIGSVMGLFFSVLSVYAVRRWRPQNQNVYESTDDTYSPMHALYSVLLLGVLLFGVCMFLPGSFKHQCIDEGFQWQMGYPARDFELTSKNSLLGCTVHGGHYHFVDEREYEFFMDVLQ